MEDYQLKSTFLKLEKAHEKLNTICCPKQKKEIVRVCVSPACSTQNSLICGDEKCEC